jgi:hypothetical protein
MNTYTVYTILPVIDSHTWSRKYTINTENLTPPPQFQGRQRPSAPRLARHHDLE